MYFVFILVCATISCNQVMYSSNEYKIVDLKQCKESFCGDYQNIITNGISNSIPIKKNMHAVQIPTYDTKTGFFLGGQTSWLKSEEYEKVIKIFDGNIDDATEFPIQLKAYYENGSQNVDIVFLLRWVPAQQKKTIQLRADENERKKRRLQQSTLQNISESWFGSVTSKK